MNLLLDTHSFLWFIDDNPKLSTTAQKLLESDADLLLSTASLWEIAIKVSLGKLILPLPFRPFVQQHIIQNEIELLPIQPEHLEHLLTLPFHHRDPFDRLLAAQSLVEKTSLVSVDTIFDAYGVNRAW
jgi:PIN domain nuclease of toxin-antitoxin system